MDGFKTFPPEPVVVTLSGTALELTPIRLGELPRLLAVVRPLAEEITSDPDWMALLVSASPSRSIRPVPHSCMVGAPVML